MNKTSWTKCYYLFIPLQIIDFQWSRESDLNRRPDDYKSTALPLSYPGVGTAHDASIMSGRSNNALSLSLGNGDLYFDRSSRALLQTRFDPERERTGLFARLS